MKDLLNKAETIFAAFMKLMQSVLRIFGVTDGDDERITDLNDAVKEFTDTIGTIAD